MQRVDMTRDHADSGPIPWAIQMRGVSPEEPGRLIRTLTGAILGCGGWVLSRGAGDSGAVNLVFEFERRLSEDIYIILIAAGVELSPSAHSCFTELCQCTRMQEPRLGAKIASVDLEVQTLPDGSDLDSTASRQA